MWRSILKPRHTGRKIKPQIKPLYIGAARAGFVRPALALTLTRWPAVFHVGEHAVHVHDLAGRVKRVWSLTISDDIDDKGMLLCRKGNII